MKSTEFRLPVYKDILRVRKFSLLTHAHISLKVKINIRPTFILCNKPFNKSLNMWVNYCMGKHTYVYMCIRKLLHIQ